jgi:hypothetical protein
MTDSLDAAHGLPGESSDVLEYDKPIDTRDGGGEAPVPAFAYGSKYGFCLRFPIHLPSDSRWLPLSIPDIAHQVIPVFLLKGPGYGIAEQSI